ncbi:Conserved oligomeric Golgi complex component 8,related, related [Eimeria praecox]|uniref:Conserved oligomeric Golgi complex subunit 8 n=1 Tax=Eimeria praecox TaxID=51316 RepID=U6GH35_9EIME|nr:Conserved oligomeric Golgi complex component 8,related, related [Eimeria praecox]
MAPSEQFWQLLLGGEQVAACSRMDSAQGFEKAGATQLRESTQTHVKQELGDAATKFSSSSEQLDAQQKTGLDTAKSLGIDEFLQMSSDDLCRQPALLHTQAEKLVSVQDELAVQNCSLFLASSKALNSLSSSVSIVGIRGGSPFTAFGQRRHRSSKWHLTLLELPSLVLKCSNGGLHDEAVDAMMLADERIASLRASGCCDMPLLDFLEMQMKEARKSCVKAMLRQLGQHAQLSSSVKLIGPLRRLNCSEEQLKVQYLRRRDGEISRQRRNAEGSCETDPAHGLCAAAELLRVDVLQTAINYRNGPRVYRAIFGSTDGRLSAWLGEQCYFFPVVALTFDRYVIAVHQQRLEGIAAAFARSIDEYDCVPSTVHLSLLGTSPWFQSDLSVNRGCVFLLRHAPLSNLYNSILEVANAFQECPISTTAAGVVSLIESLLAFCIRKLISVKPGRRENFEEDINATERSLVRKDDGREGSGTCQAEFFVLCDIFATVLLPAVEKQLSFTFPLQTGLATEVIALMA